MSEIPVTRAELYDANIQYIIGDYWTVRDVEEGNHRKASKECATVHCKSIELIYPGEGILLKITREQSKPSTQAGVVPTPILYKQEVFYSGAYFIAQEGDHDQTRR